MPACRLIFRIDFETCYELIDHPGKVMRMIEQNSPKNFWPEIRENRDRRGVSGWYSSVDKRSVRQLTVEPATIVASFESVTGIELHDLSKEESFSIMTKIADAVCKEFHIDKIKRSGIRIFYFNKLDTRDNVLAAFRGQFKEQLVANTESILGPVMDYAINLRGSLNGAEVSYNYRFGPILNGEDSSVFFDQIATIFEQENDFDFICDLDLVERDFLRSSISWHRWYTPLIDKAIELMKNLEPQCGGKKHGPK